MLDKQDTPQINNSSLDIKNELLKYISNWRWFLLSTFLTLLIAFIYLRYADKTYNVNTSILIKEDNKSDLSNQLSAFSELGFGGSKNNIENEIEILKSRTLAEKVIDSLKINYTYFSEGNVKTTEVYLNTPFTLNFSPLKQYSQEDYSFVLENIANNSFTLSLNEKKIGNFKINVPIKTEFGTITISKNKSYVANLDKEGKKETVSKVIVKYAPISLVAQNLIKNTNITPTSKTSSVLNLGINSSVPEKAVDYLNTLVSFYNIQGIADKRFISQHTSDFISNRLNIIAEELGDVEKNVEGYKNSNSLTDIETEVKLFLENLSAYERSVIENETEINVTNDLINHLRRSKSDDLVPNILLNSNAAVNSGIDELNKLILEKQRILTGSTAENPTVIKIESQISSSRNNIVSTLRSSLGSLKIIKNDLKRQENEMQSKLSQVPRQEREFRIIDRQQKVKEALYLFLLQKREETNITLAATELNAKVIDKAILPNTPVSPKSLIIVLAALALGLIIPFVIIYITNLLDNKIKTRLDLEGKTPIPFLGDVPSSESSNQIMELNSRSSAAEAIRIVRTNLEFMISDLPKEACKVIFSTSTFPGEGKTFISANIAATIALSSKKTLLIGMDIRNPKLNEYLNIPSVGITNFLSNKEAKISDYIVNIPNYESFDVLPAGTIPPNPAELLMSNKMETMFAELRSQYDYIIVDTAPISLVTDTLLIAKYADAFIYVIRSGKLDKQLLNIPETLYKENKLPRMSILLNDTDSTKGYGYGYGYGVDKEVKSIPIWKKILGIK